MNISSLINRKSIILEQWPWSSTQSGSHCFIDHSIMLVAITRWSPENPHILQFWSSTSGCSLVKIWGWSSAMVQMFHTLIAVFKKSWYYYSGVEIFSLFAAQDVVDVGGRVQPLLEFQGSGRWSLLWGLIGCLHTADQFPPVFCFKTLFAPIASVANAILL